MEKKVTIYSTPSCHFCHAAKAFFDEHAIAYEDINVAENLEKRKEMKTISGQMGVPVINIDGKIIVGYDQNTIARALGV